VEQRATVLIVDDIEATRTGLAKLLRLRGYDTLEASNGNEALESLKAHPETRVVILDLRMPGGSGYRFREEQLREPAIAGVPVVVFTGTEDVEAIKQELLVADVLRKPISVDALLEAVARWAGV
jgi:CheY-like chemotaxis protein